jgi:Hemerythrin HHE cation binding domain
VLLPHEHADEQQLVPLIARVLDGADSTAALSRTHAEIAHQIATLHRLLAGMDNANAAPEDVIELRRLLYGLYAILRLHNAQEDEGAIAIIPAGKPPIPVSSQVTSAQLQRGGDDRR